MKYRDNSIFTICIIRFKDIKSFVFGEQPGWGLESRVVNCDRRVSIVSMVVCRDANYVDVGGKS